MIPLVDQQSRTEADGGTVMTFSVRIPSREKIGGPREAEMAVQQALHKAGGQIMETVLARYDTDGEPIKRSGVWYTSKGRQEETYQSVFAPCTVMRHVYQNGEGGKTWCPLEERGARPHYRECHLSVRRNHRREVQRAERTRHRARSGAQPPEAGVFGPGANGGRAPR